MQKANNKWGANKLILVLIAAGLCLLAACFLVARFLETGRINPLVLLTVAAIISIALPMLRSNFFPSAKDCTAEYDFHDKRLAEQIRQQIDHEFGPSTLNQLFGQSDRWQDAANHCLQLLETDKVRNNATLRFGLLLTLARFCEQSGDPHQSIQHLKKALVIQPHNFIANFRLAMNYEWVNRGYDAIRHYQQSLKDPDGISRAMEKLVTAQIARIQTNGK